MFSLKKEILSVKVFLNDIKESTYQNVWDWGKITLRGKTKTLNLFTEKEEKGKLETV